MITLDPEAVRKLFMDHKDHNDILIALYRLVLPEWDRIVELKGWPKIHTYTWDQICVLFVAFDRIHHPDCISGWVWTNSGFSVDNDVPHWKVSLDACEVITDRSEINHMIADIYNIMEKKS